MQKISEKQVEDYFVKQVEKFGGEVRKLKWINRRGAPDRLILFPDGLIAFVELKRPNKKRADSHQLREHARLQFMGQDVWLVNDKGNADFVIKKYVRNYYA